MSTAVLFSVWTVVLLPLDNVLKPLMMGRGLDVPILVIFLGAIGGFVDQGLVTTELAGDAQALDPVPAAPVAVVGGIPRAVARIAVVRPGLTHRGTDRQHPFAQGVEPALPFGLEHVGAGVRHGECLQMEVRRLYPERRCLPRRVDTAGRHARDRAP